MFLFDYTPDPEILLEPPRPAPGVKPVVGEWEIDWVRPETKGLLGAWCSKSWASELVYGAPKCFSLVGSYNPVFFNGGLVTDTTDDTFISTGFSDVNEITGYPFTMLLHAQKGDSNNGFGFSQSTNDTSQGSLQIQGLVGGSYRCVVYEDAADGGTFQPLFGGTTLSDFEEAVICFVAPSSDMSTWRVYLNGYRDDSGTTGTASFPSSMDRFTIGGLNRLTSFAYGGAHYFASWWGRELSDIEARSLTTDPYQLLRPKHNKITLPYTRTSDDNLVIPDARFEAPELWLPNRKPSGPVAIDWDHKYTDGLIAAAVPSGNLQFPVMEGYNRGKPVDGGFHTNINFSDVGNPLSGLNYKGFVAFRSRDRTSGQYLFRCIKYIGPSDNGGYWLRVNPTTYEVEHRCMNNNGPAWQSTGVAIEDNKLYAVRFTCYANGYHYCSVYDLEDVTLLGSASQTTSRRDDLDMAYWAANNPFDTLCAYVWDNDKMLMTADDWFTLAADPYQFLIPA